MMLSSIDANSPQKILNHLTGCLPFELTPADVTLLLTTVSVDVDVASLTLTPAFSVSASLISLSSFSRSDWMSANSL